MENYLTTQEIAARLQTTARTVRDWITQKEDPLPSVNLGKSYRVKESDLVAWLSRR
jgi:excisionase family DNA binding protein